MNKTGNPGPRAPYLKGADFAPKDAQAGYRLLVASIIESALDDLATPTERSSALNWLADAEPRPWSITDCCVHLGISTQRVLTAAERRLRTLELTPEQIAALKRPLTGN